MSLLFGSAIGQATTEFTVIGGIGLVVAIGFVAVMNPTVRQTLQQSAECVVSDVCTQTPNDSSSGAPAVFPGTGATGGQGSGNIPPSSGAWPIPATACEAAMTQAAIEIPACSYTRVDEALCAAGAVSPHGYDLGDGIGDVLSNPVSVVQPGGAVGAIGWDATKNANARLQNCNALWKRSECACGTCSQCDGWTDPIAGGNVVCLHNVSDDSNVGQAPQWDWNDPIESVEDLAGKVPDFDESAGFIRDVTRMMAGKDPIITENDAVRTMKQQILKALEPTSGDSSKPIELIGHSEGSIILSEALWQLRIESQRNDTPIDWSRLRVDVIGPAEMRFPPELQGHVAAYYNGGPGGINQADPIPAWIGSPDYQEALAATPRGTIAIPDIYDSYDSTNWPCTGVKCHDKHAYLQYMLKNDKQRRDPDPGTTIMVNGVDTTAEDWSSNCNWYRGQRYGPQAS